MAAMIVAIVAAATLAFGAVYPWAYLPLFIVAAGIGIAGLRRGLPPERRPLAVAILLAWAAIGAQLLPLPRDLVHTFSPHTESILAAYSLTFADTTDQWVPLSIDPARTQITLMAAGALGLYVLGLPSLLHAATVRALPRYLATFAVALALFGILTRETQNGMIYWVWRPQDGGGANQFGPFVNRNHFGGWMLMTVCVVAGLLVGQIERARVSAARRSPLAWLSSREANTILLTGAAVMVAAISLFWTLSRSAMVGFGGAAMIFVGLVLTRRHLDAGRRPIVLGALAAAAAAAVAWRGPVRLMAWFANTEDYVSRLDAWRDGWTVVRDFPVFGTGMNTYGPAMLFYQERNPGFHMAQAHNDYLQLLAEGGLLVTVPAAAAAVVIGHAMARNIVASRAEARGYWIRAGAAAGVAAVAIQEAFEFSLQIPANALLCCTLAAIALTPSATATRDRARSRVTPSPPGPRDTIA
jgi:O-antigen ligase